MSVPVTYIDVSVCIINAILVTATVAGSYGGTTNRMLWRAETPSVKRQRIWDINSVRINIPRARVTQYWPYVIFRDVECFVVYD